MAINDIARLRQQAIFDALTGGLDYIPTGSRSPIQPPQMTDPGLSEYEMPSPEQPVTPRVEYPETSRPGDTYDIQETLDLINKVYTPETTSRDRFNRLLDTFPEREEPNWARKLVASGVGWSTARKGKEDPIKAMESVMYAPFIRDLGEWKEKAGPFQQSAQLENTANVNERALAGNVVNAQVQHERNRIAEQKAADQREIGMIRANAYAAKNEGATVTIDKGSGQVIATWPSGEMKYLGRIPGSSTAAELANLEGKWRVDVAKTQAESAAGVAGIREGVIYQDGPFFWTVGPRGVVPLPGTNAPPTLTPGAKPINTTTPRESHGEREGKRQEALRNIALTEPELAKGILSPGKNGDIMMIPRPIQPKTRTGAGGIPPNAEEHADLVRRWDTIQRRIDPSYRSPDDFIPTPTRPDVNLPPDTGQRPPTQPTAPAPPTQQPQIPQQGWVYFRRSDGVIKKIPMSALPEARKQDPKGTVVLGSK